MNESFVGDRGRRRTDVSVIDTVSGYKPDSAGLRRDPQSQDRRDIPRGLGCR